MGSRRRVKMNAFHFGVNDYVMLDTESHGMIEGFVEKHDKQQTRFKLRDVSIVMTKRAICRPLFIHRSAIRSATRIKQSVWDSHRSGSLGRNPYENGISAHELYLMRLLWENYIWISGHSERYVKALHDLNRCEKIGFLAEKVGFQSLHIFAMSTPSRIYLIDMQGFEKPPDDMKKILECEAIKKITYDSAILGSSLKREYDIMLNGVLDIQMADACITRAKTGTCPSPFLEYEECVSKYLKIPAQVYIQKPTLSEDGAPHPLSEKFKTQLAKNISFMQTLPRKFEFNMLEPIYIVSNFRVNYIRCGE